MRIIAEIIGSIDLIAAFCIGTDIILRRLIALKKPEKDQ